MSAGIRSDRATFVGNASLKAPVVLAHPLSRVRVLTPAFSPHAARRPRLLEFLSRLSTRRCLFVAAPPGSGKTTLIAQFVAGQNRPCAWLTVSKAERSAATLVSRLVESINVPIPGFGSRAREALEVSSDVVAVVDALVSDLAAANQTLLLVLDDLEQIPPGATGHELIAGLVERAPADVTIILVGTEIPRVRLNRLIADQAVSGLGAADLMLTHAEIGTALRKAQVSAAPELVDQVAAKSGGMAAAVRLLAAAFRRGPDAFAELAAAQDINHMIESSVRQLDRTYQDLLEAASVYDEIDPTVLAVSADMPDALALLTRLCEIQPLIGYVGTDDSHVLFRCHRLLRDHLRRHADLRHRTRSILKSGLRPIGDRSPEHAPLSPANAQATGPDQPATS